MNAWVDGYIEQKQSGLFEHLLQTDMESLLAVIVMSGTMSRLRYGE